MTAIRRRGKKGWATQRFPRADRALDQVLLLQFVVAALALVDDGDRLTVREAAALALRTERTIERWCARFRIGHLDKTGCWVVSRRKLRALLVARGALPRGFDAECRVSDTAKAVQGKP